MDLENTQVQMRKGILEYCILHIIARGEVYASNMIDELTSAKMIVVEGTLYPLLTRLKNSGLLEYKWVESKSGPPVFLNVKDDSDDVDAYILFHKK